VLLSEQDPASYPTSNARGNARDRGKGRRTMEMSATVRWMPRTVRGSAVKADYAPGLESRVRGNAQAQVRRGAVGNVPQGNALAAYSTHQPQSN